MDYKFVAIFCFVTLVLNPSIKAQESAETLASQDEIPADVSEPSALDIQTLKYVGEDGRFSMKACMADDVPAEYCAGLITHQKKMLIVEEQAKQDASQARQNAAGDRLTEEARELLEVLGN